MPTPIKPFSRGQTWQMAREQLNSIVHALNAMGLRGDEIIRVNQTEGGRLVSLDIAALDSRLPKLAPGKWGKAPTIWVSDGTATGNGSYVNVNPCKRDGTENETGTTHKVWLPRNGRREDPNVQVDNVISYTRSIGGEYVNPSGCLDGKVNETVRIHLDPTNVPAGWTAYAVGKYLVGYQAAHAYFGSVANTFGVEKHRHGLGNDVYVANYPENIPVNVFAPNTAYTLNDDHFPPTQVVQWIKRTS